MLKLIGNTVVVVVTVILTVVFGVALLSLAGLTVFAAFAPLP